MFESETRSGTICIVPLVFFSLFITIYLSAVRVWDAFQGRRQWRMKAVGTLNWSPAAETAIFPQPRWCRLAVSASGWYSTVRRSGIE